MFLSKASITELLVAECYTYCCWLWPRCWCCWKPVTEGNVMESYTTRSSLPASSSLMATPAPAPAAAAAAPGHKESTLQGSTSLLHRAHAGVHSHACRPSHHLADAAAVAAADDGFPLVIWPPLVTRPAAAVHPTAQLRPPTLSESRASAAAAAAAAGLTSWCCSQADCCLDQPPQHPCLHLLARPCTAAATGGQLPALPVPQQARPPVHGWQKQMVMSLCEVADALRLLPYARLLQQVLCHCMIPAAAAAAAAAARQHCWTSPDR
ncbi:hypothetical protein COO60DRAFT_467835 [Scenedesmus sp. NREL 46B-D3]|nr:hypothetical protein COO60DRAFT_467835 [Scenedesmus sp. NREL 46B-D3]